MSMMRDFVAKFTEEECRKICQDHKQLESKGAIGESVLRSKTKQFMEISNTKEAFTLLIMTQMAAEVWRRYAMPFLGEWRPMSEAPQDGTFFLACFQDPPSGYAIANYIDWCGNGEYAFRNDRGTALEAAYGFKLKGWMPLPPISID